MNKPLPASTHPGVARVPAGASVAAREHVLAERVLLNELRDGASVLIPISALAMAAWVTGYASANRTFLVLWTVGTLGAALVHWYLVRMFRALESGMEGAFHARWLFFARHGFTLFGLLYAALVVGTFQDLDDIGRLGLAIFSSVFIADSLGRGLAGRGMLYASLLGISAAWYLHGEGLANRLAALHFIGLLLYIAARNNMLKVQLDRVTLIEHERELGTSLQRANAELERRSLDRSFQIAATSHDLRHPAHSIDVVLETLETVDDPVVRDRRWGQVRASINEMTEMLESLMDASQLQLEMYAVKNKEFSLAALLENAIRSYREIAHKKGLTFQVDIEAARQLSIYSDRGLLNRMVSNLLINAIKYTSHGGVTVSAYLRPDGSLVISIVDTGPGIAMERHREVFRPFIRGGDASMAEGLGIGLSVVEEGARLLGLDVELQSALEMGSTFSIIFMPGSFHVKPEEGRSSGAVVVATDEVRPVLAGLKVLLVDDDPAICVAMARTLGSFGCEAKTAHSIGAAQDILNGENWTPGLLITDYQLSAHENGLECIRMVRGHRLLEALPALLLTGDVLVTLDHGFDPRITNVLRKPLQPPVLYGMMVELVSGAGLQ